MLEADDRAPLSACEYFWEVHVPSILEMGNDTTMPSLTCAVEFRISGEDGGEWNVSVREGLIERIARGPAADTTARVMLSASTFLDIARGLVDHRQAFFKGQIEIEGDVGLVLQASNMIPILREKFPFREPAHREVRS